MTIEFCCHHTTVTAIIRRWDQQLSKTKFFNRSSQTSIELSTVSPSTVDLARKKSNKSLGKIEDEMLPAKNSMRRSKVANSIVKQPVSV